MFRGRVRSIHFVGIGGIGMSGIAEVLLAHGFAVSGSDLRESDTVVRLRTLGATVHIGHRAENLQRADVLVFSSAVKRDNPELVSARAAGTPVIPRAEMLAELMRLKDGIAIAGSHGKTTTTSLVATVLREAGLDPTVIIGGKLNALGSNAARGAGSLLVTEADESDGSFLHLTPAIAVVTNIDAEHLDYYGDLEHVKSAFVSFANRVPFYGLVIACLDHPHVQDVLPRIDKRIATYGLATQAEYRAKNPSVQGLQTSFEVVRRGESLGAFEVRMPGIHNVLNALAAIAVVDELGVPLEQVKRSLAAFGGVQRRFTIVGEHDGITIVDDYGHHPAEVVVTLEAAQRAYGRRILVAFQPHRYTRTQHCFDELTRAFNRADVLFLTDVYAAGEEPIAGADSATLAQAVRAHGHRDVTLVPKVDDLAAALAVRAQPGDVIVTMGAGNITHVGRTLLARLQSQAVKHGA
ncbi:MAG: UDP-N-acetylmuramate--alanine ligase [Myxococcaceae bacterium]|nr:UDP-N-acetylmuramate--alanine ligase [Myxococcaceae bacterium]